jgi:hypothetical protein
LTHFAFQAVYPLAQLIDRYARFKLSFPEFELGFSERVECARVGVQLRRERGNVPIRAACEHPSGGDVGPH